MPTIICPDCGGNVSPMARACPHCGRPTKGFHDEVHGFYAIVVTITFIIGTGLGFVTYGMSDSLTVAGLAAMGPVGVAFLWISNRHS